jgi:gliding motility-associated-like protein
VRGLYKILLGFLLLAGNHVFAQCPPNIGFEDGTFSGWICSVGSISMTGDISVNDVSPQYNRQTLISTSTLDPYGHFPTLCPNGSKYSVRLGNDQTKAEAERMSYLFTVPAGRDYNLVLNYAVVLQNPDHEAYQQPKFTAKVFNVTDGVYIDCPAFNFVASSDLPGFKLSDVGSVGGGQSASTIYYKEWSATTINLVGYGGKTVRLEFTTNDCTRGGHFGYAYIDVNEECTQAISGGTYCMGQDSITLHAPNGFYDYYWYDTSHPEVPIGRGESLTLKPAPPDQTKIALNIVPYPGLGCPDTLYTIINRINEDFKLKVADTVWGCDGVGADLTAASITTGSSPGMTYSYFTNPVTLDYVYNPKGVLPGTYYIRGINQEGCSNILPVHVMIRSKPVINIRDPLPVQYPQTVDLSAVYTPLPGQTYSYYSDAKATIPLASKNVSISGTYYIKAINNFGCETVTYTTVVVKPPAPIKISGPNVFTPNNDGVNDYFSLKIDGFVAFGNLKIFNRYGQLMFNAKSQYEVWDGNYNGHPLPPGTYYWVFEGTDPYYNINIKKAASISIER